MKRYLACVLLVVASMTVHAQSVSAVPPPDPGIYDPALDRQRLERQQREEQARERADRLEVPALRGDTPAEQQLPDSDESFVLGGIRFNRSRFIEAERLEKIAAAYVGAEITFDDLNRLLKEINAIYDARGLLTARAIIPPQTVADGELRVVLVEAELEGVEWARDPETVGRDFYEARVAYRTGEVLDAQRLTQEIQRLNATTTGPQLSANLMPGETFGTTRIQFEPFEPDPLAWQLFANNYGSESSGEHQLGLSGVWFSPTGHADSLSAVILKTRGTTYGNLRYGMPVNRYNGLVFGRFSRNRLKIVKGPYKDLDIEGDSQEWQVGYEQPWWLNEAWMLVGEMAYLRSRSETTIEDAVELTHTEMDSVTATATVRYRSDSWYLTYAQTLEFAASDNFTYGTSGNYTLTSGDLFARRRWNEAFWLIGKLGWQFTSADDDLPSTLLYQLGGPASVRGYTSGILAAPRGIDMSLEGHWRFHPDWEASLLLDAGHVLDSEIPEDTIASLGVGLGYRYGKRLSIDAAYAHAMNDVVPDQDAGQLLVKLAWRL